jgi:hypothetical protein
MRWVWLSACFAACLDPTEVTLELSSDACGQIGEVEIFVGDSTTPVAVTSKCDPANGRIGSLVLVPSKSPNPIVVRARTHLANGTCDGKNPFLCIRAARSVRYVAHHPLELPIALDRACVDVSCAANETCFSGTCVPMDVDDHCMNGVCTPSPSDAGLCEPPYVNAPTGMPWVWHFDSPMVVDQYGKCPAAPIDVGPGNPMTTCGTAAFEKAFDGSTSWAEMLGCPTNPSAGQSFHVAFWFRVPPSGGIFLQKLEPVGAGASGWSIEMGTAATLVFASTLSTGASMSVPIGGALMPGSWHAIEVWARSAMFSAWLDKMPAVMVSMDIGASPNAGMFIGPLRGGAIDELYIYP